MRLLLLALFALCGCATEQTTHVYVQSQRGYCSFYHTHICGLNYEMEGTIREVCCDSTTSLEETK